MTTFANKRKVHHTIFQVIIWLTIASMALSAILVKVFTRGADDEIARVNSTSIERKDFERRVEATQRRLMLLRMQFEQNGMPYDPRVFEKSPAGPALQSLVDDALVDAVARSLRLTLDEQFIANKLTDPYFLSAELPEFIPPYVLAMASEISKQSIERMLAHEHVRISDFEQHVEKSLARRVVRDIVTAAVYVPAYAVRQAYTQQYAAKTFDVLVVPFQGVLSQIKARELDQKEVKKYYDQERKKYQVPEKRSATVWEFEPTKYGIQVSEADITKYYEQHRNKYIQTPVKVKVKRIVFAVDNKADAGIAHTQAQVTRAEVMQDPTKGQWIEGDFFARGEKEASFEQVAFGLKQDGDISPVVQTKNGFEILQRVARKPAVYKTLDAVKKEVETAVKAQRFQQIFGQGVTKDSLAQFVQDHRGVQATHEKVTKQETPVSTKLFSLKTVGDFGIIRQDGKGIIVQLTAITTSYIPPLDQIKNQVEQDLAVQMAKTELRKQVNEAATQAKKMSLADVVAAHKGDKWQVRTISQLKGDDTERIKQLTKENVPVVQMLEMERAGQTSTAIETDGFVIRLSTVAPVTPEQLAPKQQELKATLNRDWTGVLYQGFIASLARSATILLNENALTQA